MQTALADENSRSLGTTKLQRQATLPPPADSHSWLWLLIAAALLPFAGGAHNIALAAWLAPVFLLRFTRTQPLKLWLPVAYVLLVAVGAFQSQGIIPVLGIAFYLVPMVYSIPAIAPYVIDCLLARRLNGLALTLAFPTAWVAKEYLTSFGPYGSWGSVAYTQYGNLPLLQIVSVTGLWSIPFLIGWFAAVCNWIWQVGFQSKSARRGAWLCLGTIAGVILVGGARLSLFRPSSETVRVASISKRQAPPNPALRAAVQRVLSGKATSDDMNAFNGWAAANDDDLLSRSEREMQAGAKITFWSETDGIVTKENEAALVARGADLAVKYHVYLGMALGVWNTGRPHPFDDKVVLIQPDGHVAWEYTKTHPVPGSEAALEQPGDGKLRELDTPYGRLSSIICFDADFPRLLAQAGSADTDVVLDSSSDWPAIDPIHTQMASFRAIEQGFNLIKETTQGLSAAFDYQGRRLAATDYYHTSDYAMISDVPTRGVRTIYSRFGNWFAWLCIADLFLLTGVSFQRRHT